MVPVERYCLQCGAACVAGDAACAACGASLKTTLPLDEEADESYPLTHLSGPLPEHYLLSERYRIVRKVGGGGFGAVYEAEDTLERRRVALKAISLPGPTPQHAGEASDAFKREAELLASLRHPALPRIYGQIIESEHWYLAMEFIAGETLEERLARAPDGRLPLEQALQIGIQLCDVLEYLHSHQPAIIYRDLKPANIMLTSTQQVYVIDFGVARRYKPGKPKDTIAFGSPGYAAPEQYGRAQTTPRSDLYGLGATLHQILTGQDPSLSPFRFQPLSLFDRAMPLELEKLIAQMLETDMERRPASASEVRQRLQAIVPAQSATRRKKAGAQGRQSPSSPAALASAFSTVGVTVSIYRGHGAPVYSLAWTPDGSAIASCDEEHVVSIWDAFRPSPVRVLPTGVGHGNAINDLAWSPDGGTLAAASDDWSVRLWHVDAHPRWWQRLSLSFGFRTDIYRGHSTPVNALCWSPDGKKIVSAEAKSAIHIWDAYTLEHLQLYQGHSDIVEDVAWAPDGRRIASSSIDHSVHIWDAVSAKRLRRWYVKGSAVVHTLSWSPDSRYLACGTSKGRVQIWDIVKDRQVFDYHTSKAAINSVAWSPDGRHVASASNDGIVHLWSALDGRESFVYRSHEESVLSVAWSPDGQHIASADREGLVHIWKAV